MRKQSCENFGNGLFFWGNPSPKSMSPIWLQSHDIVSWGLYNKPT